MKELEVEISGELEPRSTTSSFFISVADKRAPALDFIAVDLTCKYIFIHSHVVRSFVDGGEMLRGAGGEMAKQEEIVGQRRNFNCTRAKRVAFIVALFSFLLASLFFCPLLVL